ASPVVFAQETLTYDQALQLLRERSDAIHAADYQVEREYDLRGALDRLHLPTLNVTAGVLAYGSERTLNIEPLQSAIGQVIPGAETLIPGSIDLDFKGTSPTAALMSSWLLYTGGRTTAARRFADANIDQAKAERQLTVEHQDKVLATIYFGHLLAGRVLRIREDVLAGVERHLHQATRFEDKGVLSKVERMHAQVAYDEARRNLEQARADFGIADVALRQLLRHPAPIRPQTPLFVSTQPLSPLMGFLESGLKDHSQLALLQAKRKQAEQGKVIEEARWKPTVAAFGAYNLTPRDADFSDPLPLLEPDWVVGINLSYPLFDRLNRGRLVSAAERQIQRVDALERELQTGLATVIERSYLSVERARAQFVLLQSNIELTDETVRLRERLFEEGLGTSLDVVDARLAAARAETERVVAAYEYVVSLVGLLEASSQLEQFSEYVRRADVHLALGESSQ
ncbi:MAG: TolC family protein, partial [Woeseiaceae bacterium]|nr:TolC family protein [Woeseiaceae bacterium]